MPLEQNEVFCCPYCGEENALSVDFSAGRTQKFVVDCEVCCSPIIVRLTIQGEEIIALDIQKENQ